MLLWIWIAVVVVGLIILGVAAVRLFGRLAGLRRAARRLLRRQSEVTKLQAGVAALEQSLLGLQQRGETLQQRMAVISTGDNRK